jgi:hypothetical protein
MRIRRQIMGADLKETNLKLVHLPAGHECGLMEEVGVHPFLSAAEYR